MAMICLLFAAAHALSNPPLMQKHWASSLFNLRWIVRFVFLSGGQLQFHGRCSYLFRRNHWPCADVSGRIQQVSYSLKVAKAASVTNNACLNLSSCQACMVHTQQATHDLGVHRSVSPTLLSSELVSFSASFIGSVKCCQSVSERH